jgi:hypothetical protein
MGQSVSASRIDLDELEIWMTDVLSRGQKGMYVIEISWSKYREYHKVLTQD